MTTKTTAWFDGIRKNANTRGKHNYWTYPKGRLGFVMAALGRVIYTNVRINGKTKRVLIWKP